MTDAEYLAKKLHIYAKYAVIDAGMKPELRLEMNWENLDAASRKMTVRVAKSLLQHDVILHQQLIEVIARSAAMTMVSDDPDIQEKIDQNNRNVADSLAWMIKYIIDERFSPRHLEAICHIIGLFNDSEESEAEIFAFAENLYEKYAR